MIFIKKHSKYIKKFKKFHKSNPFNDFLKKMENKSILKNFYNINLNYKNTYYYKLNGCDYYIQCPESKLIFMNDLINDIQYKREPQTHSYDKFIIYAYKKNELVVYFKDNIFITTISGFSDSITFSLKEKVFKKFKNSLCYFGNVTYFYCSDLLNSCINEPNTRNGLKFIMPYSEVKNIPYMLMFERGKIIEKSYSNSNNDNYIPNFIIYNNNKREIIYNDLKKTLFIQENNIKIPENFFKINKNKKLKKLFELNFET